MATPRERRQAKTRQAILDAARRILAEKGVDGLSMRALARRIDYSAAGLYEYFGSKEEIIEAVCWQGHERLQQAMARVDDALPDEEYLTELGRAYIDFAAGNPDFFLLMFTSLTPGFAPSSADPQMMLDEMMSGGSSFPILYRGIERGVANGSFILQADQNVMDLALNAWIFVHGVAMLWLTQLQYLEIPLDWVRQQAQATFLRGIRA